jgi:uncharacterized protein
MPHGDWRDEDLFAIPVGGSRYYLYAPLRQSFAVVNDAAVAAVGRYLEGGPDGLSADDAALLRSLEEQGLLGGTPPEPPLFPSQAEFRPHEVTLFLTTRCNLRCRYCYADAGRRAVEMPWETARAAVDLVAENAGWLGSPKFGVGFHGGGEPTLAWDTLVRVTEHAEARAEELGLDADLYVATNGVLPVEWREFLVEHFSTANISLDGPEDIQDYNRPRADGGGSFAAVRETIRHFDEVGFHYGVRATVTAATAPRMAEIVDRLASEFGLAYLHMEPVWQCGRCLTTGEEAPDDDVFAEGFAEAVRVGRQFGVEVTYSGARLGLLTSKFCAAPGDGFAVLPEGIATSCFEVTEAGDLRAAIFHYGRLVPESGAWEFDEARIDALRRMSVEHIEHCRDCFCKWHCAGDCLAKVFARSGAPVHLGSIRCELNRRLTLASMGELVETAAT